MELKAVTELVERCRAYRLTWEADGGHSYVRLVVTIPARSPVSVVAERSGSAALEQACEDALKMLDDRGFPEVPA
jgi:hypothetical protein